MHLCFIDESGTPAKLGQKEPGTFVIGAVVIPETTWHVVREKLVGLKSAGRYHGEIKWRYFAPNNTDAENPMRTWGQPQRDEFRTSVFKIITDQRSIKLIACVCHCATAYDLPSVNSQDDIYFRTYKPVTERFQYFLQDISRSTGTSHSGIIVADHRGSKDDAKMRQQHERLVRESGKYTSTYTNFVEGLFFAPSHMSIGIQLSDMVAGATWRAFERDDRRFFDQIKGSFRAKPTGEIDGFGLVKFPTIWN
ncbi:DUF3800 domain-containing protein [Albidovulum sp.]|uniref:DUF3800 domain-containing protein n=1 Tax=Albidovulum sp. TaxID=1872424 RepID=UPI0039B888F8